MNRLIAALTALTISTTAAMAMPSGPQIVVDAGTGTVLSQKEADLPWYPASLTKMMTLYVVLTEVAEGRVRFDDLVTMTPEAVSQPPSKTNLKVGQRLRLDDALKVMMVKSANDVAMALAQRISGSSEAFAVRMNEKAAELGMASSSFRNPNGLQDPAQQVTARDLAILAQALVASPAAISITSLDGVTLDGNSYFSGNGLVGRIDGTDGLKTGYLCSSGFNLVTTSSKGGRRTIVVVLGHPSSAGRDAAAAQLVESSFTVLSSTEGHLQDRRMATSATPPDLTKAICNSQGRRKPGVGDADGIDPAQFVARKRKIMDVAVIRSIPPTSVVNVASEKTSPLPPSATAYAMPPIMPAPPLLRDSRQVRPAPRF
jgi:D-alanyl-D-alanine carboxypeptidase